MLLAVAVPSCYGLVRRLGIVMCQFAGLFLLFTVYVTCGSVNKIVCIYLVRHCNGSESMY